MIIKKKKKKKNYKTKSYKSKSSSSILIIAVSFTINSISSINNWEFIPVINFIRILIVAFVSISVFIGSDPKIASLSDYSGPNAAPQLGARRARNAHICLPSNQGSTAALIASIPCCVGAHIAPK